MDYVKSDTRAVVDEIHGCAVKIEARAAFRAARASFLDKSGSNLEGRGEDCS